MVSGLGVMKYDQVQRRLSIRGILCQDGNLKGLLQ